MPIKCKYFANKYIDVYNLKKVIIIISFVHSKRIIRGSMGCVHIGCLEQWLNISSHTFCELCSYRFEVIQMRRYSFWQSIRVWFHQNHSALYKTLFFVILSAINSTLLCWMWLLWILSMPRISALEKENEDDEEKPLEERQTQPMNKPKWFAVFVFLTLLTAFSIKSLCCDAYRTVKNQYQAWYHWWNETVNVQLVLDLQNYKLNNKVEEVNDSLKHAQEIPLNQSLRTEEIKKSDHQNDNNTDQDKGSEIPQVHRVQNSNQSTKE